MSSQSIPSFAQPDRARSSWKVTWAVWQALFLREANNRLYRHGRAGWFWLVLEPISHTIYLMMLFTILHAHIVPGVTEIGLFIALGVYGFQTFKFAAQPSIQAIDANSALFAYRQVKPVDTALVRSALEGLLQLVAQTVIMTGATLVGFNVLPADPLSALVAIALLWLLGASVGLVLSALTEVVHEIGKIANVIFTFFYAFSGVMFLPEAAPHALRKWLVLNPVISGIEPLRHAFFPTYRLISGISLWYLASCTIGIGCLGLALHVHLKDRLRAL